MRKSTITSLLILCGSTAALANAAVPVGQTTQTMNNTVANDPTLDNSVDTTTVPNETATNAVVDETSTMPAETPTMGNETSTTEPR